MALSKLLAKPLSDGSVQGILGAERGDVTLLEIRDCAAKLGLGLRGVRASIEEIRGWGVPCLVHLRNPNHFIVVSGISARDAVVMDQGLTTVVGRDSLAARYSGIALVSTVAGDRKSGISIEKPVRSVQFRTVGVIHEEVIEVANRGDTSLQLKAEPQCGTCVEVNPAVSVVAPGGRATLKVRIRAREWGDTVDLVQVESTDELCPVALVAFKVTMPERVLVRPDRLVLRAPEGQGGERRTLTVLVPHGTSVSRCSVGQPFVSAKLVSEEKLEAGTAYRIDVSVGAKAPVGSFSDEVLVELRGADVPSASVLVDGFIEPDITVRPGGAFFGMVAPGTLVRRTMVVQSASGRAFGLNGVAAKDAPHVQVIAECGVARVRHEIEVVVNGKGDPGDTLRGRVQVQLSNGRTLEFGVFAMIAVAHDKATAAPSQEGK